MLVCRDLISTGSFACLSVLADVFAINLIPTAAASFLPDSITVTAMSEKSDSVEQPQQQQTVKVRILQREGGVMKSRGVLSKAYALRIAAVATSALSIVVRFHLLFPFRCCA